MKKELIAELLVAAFLTRANGYALFATTYLISNPSKLEELVYWNMVTILIIVKYVFELSK